MSKLNLIQLLSKKEEKAFEELVDKSTKLKEPYLLDKRSAKCYDDMIVITSSFKNRYYAKTDKGFYLSSFVDGGIHNTSGTEALKHGFYSNFSSVYSNPDNEHFPYYVFGSNLYRRLKNKGVIKLK